MLESLRERIEDFYLPKQLVEAILEVGGIPEDSQEVDIGIGFIDIADYTFLSKFLTPKENQLVLNGLYTAFNSVLRRHGGYLNKIEGDSLMFHYGGLIDPKARHQENPDETRLYIARELFFTCIEMQRVAVVFNRADSRFLDDEATLKDRQALEESFKIVQRLRSDSELSSTMTAMFQIRIRIGANLGEVTIGNFGPEGARQWDVIGLPVIDAKRMESTAPVGGLRISSQYYQILNDHGIAEEYYQRFRREADALGSRYASITREEVFAGKKVFVRDKKNAAFETFSVQVNPELPEQIADQAVALLEHGRIGANMIVELFEYYRGNRFVVAAMEHALTEVGIVFRKSNSYEMMYPRRFKEMLKEASDDPNRVEAKLREEFSTFDLLNMLGNYQDIIKQINVELPEYTPYAEYSQYVNQVKKEHQHYYEEIKSELAQRAYFFNVVYPVVFESLRGSILEYQASTEDLELLSG